MNLAWHYVRGVGGKMVLRDGRPAVVGEWLEHPGAIEICARGLHASWRAFDALGFCSWDGGSVCLVEADGIAAEEDDKFVCSRRRIVFAVECDAILRDFARQAALSVLHLWQGEVPAVVREYLETGREDLRAAAWAAAWVAAWAAARDAAWVAARAAAWDAVGAAARDAAWVAVGAAARDAAWVAARDAVRDAARAAAWDAVGAAARDAAWVAAWAAARDAAWVAAISDLNATLESMFFAAAIQDGFDPAVLS